MLSAECPNCGAPIVFQHSASVLAVCSACQSSILRTDNDLEKIGELSSLSQDLSPIQIGTKGMTANRAFQVIGVLRKGRDYLRWNEWRILFDNGDWGWLSEGNGQIILFDQPPIELAGITNLDVGASFNASQTEGQTPYQVTEKASAVLLAAEGELNIAVTQGQQLNYVDAREVGGSGFATVDQTDHGIEVWLGRVVEMTSLQLANLRPFVGWSDSVLLNYEGPQITSVRPLDCPQCGASLELKSPGQATSVGCAYCGSELRVDETESGMALRLYKKSKRFVNMFQIPLGSVIHFKGQRWELLGAILRSVTEDGVEYPWEEYLWRNPYVGYRWMIVSDGHFSWGGACLKYPTREGLSFDYSKMIWRDESFAPYAKGKSTVRAVVGEFTWQVSKGDTAMTYDFISPPYMLSFESIRNSTAAGGDEDNWTAFEYVDHKKMGRVLRDASKRLSNHTPEGIAPHQPNPWRKKSTTRKATLVYGSLFIAWALIFVFFFQGQNGRLIQTQTFKYAAFVKDKSEYATIYGAAEGEKPFLEIQKKSGWRSLKLTHATTPSGNMSLTAHVALINLDNGVAYLFPPGYNSEGVYVNPAVGRYALRVEHSFNKKMVRAHNRLLNNGLKITPEYKTAVRVVKNPRNEMAFAFWLLFALLLIIGPIAYGIFRSAFENQRWKNSNV